MVLPLADRTFDRRPYFDDRSRAFPIRSLIAPTARLRSYTWSCRGVLDQGAEGACVGFGWAGELLARPAVVEGVTDDVARSLYHRARELDDWPGENYDGTSVLGGAKAVAGAGFMDEYRWAFDLNDVLMTLGYHGPVVLGVNWREGMVETDDEGWIHATGEVVGGHCVFLRGVNVRAGGVLVQNSWGLEWGINGCAHMTWANLDALLHDDGEACVPVRRDRVGTLPA